MNLETRYTTWWEAAATHLSTLNPVGAEHATDQEICDAISNLLPGMREQLDDNYDTYLETIDLIGSLAAEWLNNHGKWNASDIADKLESKQQDYGHGNITAFGHLGIAVRLSDKVERMKNLQQRTTPRNESFEDTMLDIVGYCTIALMLDDGSFYMEVEK